MVLSIEHFFRRMTCTTVRVHFPSRRTSGVSYASQSEDSISKITTKLPNIDVQNLMVEDGLCTTIEQAMRTHMYNEEVQASGCLALSIVATNLPPQRRAVPLTADVMLSCRFG